MFFAFASRGLLSFDSHKDTLSFSEKTSDAMWPYTSEKNSQKSSQTNNTNGTILHQGSAPFRGGDVGVGVQGAEATHEPVGGQDA